MGQLAHNPDHQPRRASWRSSRGQGVIETIFMLIIFTAMVAFMASISAYLYLQHALVTSAREGARRAAMATDIATGTGQSNVKTYVQNTTRQLCGQTLATSAITVNPPDPAGTPGQRTVSVVIKYNMENPVNIAGFLKALGAKNTSTLATIPVIAAAVMRYEE